MLDIVAAHCTWVEMSEPCAVPCRRAKEIIAPNTIWHRRGADAILYAYIRQIYWIESPKFIRATAQRSLCCQLPCSSGHGRSWYIIQISAMSVGSPRAIPYRRHFQFSQLGTSPGRTLHGVIVCDRNISRNRHALKSERLLATI